MDKGIIFALITTLLWSTVASAFKITLRFIDFREMLFLSSLTSFFILLLINVFKGKINYLLKSNKEDIFKSALLGFLNPYLYYLVLFKAYSLLKAQIAQPLNYTWPIVLSLLSIPLLKQKLKLRNFIALIISFSGVLIISTEGNLSEFKIKNPLGVFLAISSSLIWALYWIYNVRDKREESLKLTLNFFFGFIYIFITQLITNSIRIPPLKGLIGSIYIGMFEMGITFFIWLLALKHSKNVAVTGNIIYLSPFISLIFINILVGEKILITTIIGLVLIVAGIFFQKR